MLLTCLIKRLQQSQQYFKSVKNYKILLLLFRQAFWEHWCCYFWLCWSLPDHRTLKTMMIAGRVMIGKVILVFHFVASIASYILLVFITGGFLLNVTYTKIHLDDVSRVQIKVYRGPTKNDGYAPWGFWVKQPSDED